MFSPKPILLHLPTSQKTKSKKSNENLETITLKRYCSTKYFTYLFMCSPVNFGNHSTHMKLKNHQFSKNVDNSENLVQLVSSKGQRWVWSVNSFWSTAK